MFDKKDLDDLKNRAKKAVENVKTEAQNLHSTVNEKLDEKISGGNNLSEKGSEYLSNSTLNKSVQLILEKSIKQAEDFVDKFFRPYDVHEILSPTYMDYIINELKQKQISNPSNEVYTYELAVLYFNKKEDQLALQELRKLKKQEFVNLLKPAADLSNLSDEAFLKYYQLNKESVRRARIYRFIRHYASLCFNRGEFAKSLQDLELACSLNPTSIELNEMLLATYKRLNRDNDALLQTEILKLLRGK